MRLVLSAAILTFLVDQASKLVVVHWMDLQTRGEIPVAPPLLDFRMGWNCGINFGIFSDCSDVSKWILVGLAVAIVGAIAVWAWRNPPGRLGQVAAGLLIGGALANVLDRLVYGAVADFLNMSCCGIENPFVFNLADVGVFAGALGLALFTGGNRPKGKKKAA